MRKDLDVVKKELYLPQSDEPSGLKLNLEDLHVDPNVTFRPLVYKVSPKLGDAEISSKRGNARWVRRFVLIHGTGFLARPITH